MNPLGRPVRVLTTGAQHGFEVDIRPSDVETALDDEQARAMLDRLVTRCNQQTEDPADHLVRAGDTWAMQRPAIVRERDEARADTLNATEHMASLTAEVEWLTKINAEDRAARKAEVERAVEVRENANAVSVRVESENRWLAAEVERLRLERADGDEMILGLQAEVEELNAAHLDACTQLATARAEANEAEAEVERLREALTFYANPATYDLPTGRQHDVWRDHGRRAREALGDKP